MRYRLLKDFLHYQVGHVFDTHGTAYIEYSWEFADGRLSQSRRVYPWHIQTWLELKLLQEVKEEYQCPASLPCGCASYPELDTPPHGDAIVRGISDLPPFMDSEVKDVRHDCPAHSPYCCTCPPACSECGKLDGNHYYTCSQSLTRKGKAASCSEACGLQAPYGFVHEMDCPNDVHDPKTCRCPHGCGKPIKEKPIFSHRSEYIGLRALQQDKECKELGHTHDHE